MIYWNQINKTRYIHFVISFLCIDLDSNDENMLFLQNNLGNVKDKKNILDGAMALHNFNKHTDRHISFEDMKYLVDSYPNNFVDIK